MSLSALDYRKRRGLDKRDEQMALLIQRVSGSYYGSCYMPCAAGVGYSYSPYRFLENTDPAAGMLRLVMGLGTSAVDRTEGSYPRLVNLDKPERTAYAGAADRHRYSQRKVEVIDTAAHAMERLPLQTLEPAVPQYLADILLEHDYEAESRLREMGRGGPVRFISCKGLVENPELMERMRRMLACIQKEYDYPVDIEFTINISEDREYSINLLQCRPLQVLRDAAGAAEEEDIPRAVPEEHILLESRGASMGLSRAVKLDLIVYVDPIAYYNMPYARKTDVAKMIGRINWDCRDKNRHMLLMVPGRIGTSSPELGVPTAFSDISAFEAICEMEEAKAGYNPELSYGSHIFQDLVEADILYTAVFNNDKTLHFAPARLRACPDVIADFEGGREMAGIVGVYDVRGRRCELYNDIRRDYLLLTI